MKNPNKYIRSAFVTALGSATGLGVYDQGIPIDLQPLPDKYVLVKNQSKGRFAVSKHNDEWLCSFSLDINSVNEKGFNSSVAVDDIEEAILTAAPSVQIPGFTLKWTRLVDSIPFDPLETSTHTINRTVLLYELWLNKAT